METARRALNVVWQHLGSGTEGSRGQLAGIKEELRLTSMASVTDNQSQSRPQSKLQSVHIHLIHPYTQTLKHSYYQYQHTHPDSTKLLPSILNYNTHLNF
ncbi:hypothetical protein GcM1_084005, partial [Golovinomyces cichoracearum]